MSFLGMGGVVPDRLCNVVSNCVNRSPLIREKKNECFAFKKFVTVGTVNFQALIVHTMRKMNNRKKDFL